MEKVDNKKTVGVLINELDLSKVNIGDFLTALMNFENQLREFSYDTELDIYDLNQGLVYTEDKKLVNVNTEAIQPFAYPVTNPYFENLKCLSEVLNDIFMKGEFKSTRLQQLQRECQVVGSMKPSVFISEVLGKLDKIADINTVKDYQEGLVLLRK